MTKMNFTPTGRPLITMMNSIQNVKFGGTDLQPEYQRAFIWKNEFKDKLIYSLIKGYPIGSISIRTLNKQNIKGAKEEVVDGQQRLTTIFEFMNGKYYVKSEWSKKIIKAIQEYLGSTDDKEALKLFKKLLSRGYPTVGFSDLPKIVKDNLNAYMFALTYISDATDEEIREYFRFLQNQEILRAGEIIKSLPATNLEKYLNSISDIKTFLTKINYSDDRREFDKLFYGTIGLLEEKVMFGCIDKRIQDYAREAIEPKKSINSINRIVDSINFISNSNGIQLDGHTKKRFIKFFLLLCAFGYVDFTVDTQAKLNCLERIDEDLASFFSADLDAVKNTFPKACDGAIYELDAIAKLTKGAHPLGRTKNRIEILSYYVNNGYKVSEPSGIEIEK